MEQEKNKFSNALEKIESISKDIGLSKKDKKTILKIEKTDNPDIKTLNLQSGSWEANEPWFVIDEDNNIHTLVSIESLLKIIEALKLAQQENFNQKLEKTIWQHIPIDFQDVWVVAMDEIKRIAASSKDKKNINIDIEKLIKSIKSKHPNLFFNLKDIVYE
jgi:hypothetical protein